MIKSVTVTNFLGESIKLELGSPEKSGLLIKSITGLGPSNANINAKELATSDGAVYNSARVNSRNIVMTLGFMFKPTIEDVRLLTYRYFPIKKKLKLLIETDKRICEAYGYVESNEPNIFSKEEETQISIICPDPYFYSAGPDGNTVTVFYGVEAAFEFPFSNESVDEKLLEIGIAKYATERVIYYSGDAEIGITIRIYATGEVKNLTIYNARTREYMKIDTDILTAMTGSTIVKGDEITISTVKGNKYIDLYRAGKHYNILNCMKKDSVWFQLAHGDNIFAYVADDGASNLQFRIENKTVYEGV